MRGAKLLAEQNTYNGSQNYLVSWCLGVVVLLAILCLGWAETTTCAEAEA